ncbi:MAG: hypothetical protein OEZ23_03320, partial [Gammaproteobacteria bacterium]|nr:hypothetical protein [Gammaproteobacteria bacterium]
GVCDSCHLVHNASGQKLRATHRQPDIPYMKNWCQDCHRQDGIARDKVISQHSHPLGITPDTFQAERSPLPLFSPEGKKSSKQGLIDCTTCHDPHRWAEPSLPSDKSPSSDKKENLHASFLRLPVAGDSLLCLECHKKQGLVSGTDHDMRLENAHSTNILGMNTQESGLCGQCHTMHSPTLENSLWAMNPGDGNNVKTRQCTSCHSKTGMAKDKTPEHLMHPESVAVWSDATRQNYHQNEATPDLPVHDLKGMEQSKGQITCASCHNPHQWDPHKAEAGSGRNEEGDALSSFLRNANTEGIVCADCHGKDALFRYKYFHGARSREAHPLYR